MKNINKYKKPFSTTVLMVSIFVTSLFMTACDFEFDLPEANSKEDTTPPVAKFTAATSTAGNDDDWKTYNFANLSTSATTYAWDFGDGNTSTSKDGVNTYPGEGTFTVSLTASDNLGVESSFSTTIEVVEPEAPLAIIPTIHDASFENDDSDGGATADGRDSWRLSGASVMQITSSPVYDGAKAAKFPSDGSRNAYQELTVSKNTDYVLTYYYTMKTSPAGSITVAITPGTAASFDDIATPIATSVGTDQTDANAYVKVDFTFNTGDNNVVGLLISNEGNESRIDSFSIDVAQ
ncbi:PKD domain-containing protein [Bacteroidota bacterium]